MSCFGCSKKYGLFCKEHGCPNCGYSYCAKCLKRPIAVPRHENKVLNVCLICYDKLSKLEAIEKVVDCEALPGTLVSRPRGGKKDNIDVLSTVIFGEDDSNANLGEVLTPTTNTTNTAEPSDTHSNMKNSEINENLDHVISKRLHNLKATDNPTTDAEIRERLANLSGIPHKDYSKKDVLLSTDKRSDQQKMNDLLEQFLGENQIDQRLETERNDSITDIERRLRALRDMPVIGTREDQLLPTDKNTPSDNEEDDETILKRVMQKYLAEARLPEPSTDLETELSAGIPPPPAGSTSSDMQELPWCNICNEDAVYRCKGCDGELFCAQCFRECHDDDEEYRAHTKVTYTAPPNFKENHFS